LKFKELIKLLEKDGWYLVRQKGSHQQYHHSTKRGTVTIAGKSNDDIAKGTLNNILKQAQLK
jgi:predicted RNA binding protein YcfA (HicA-like mRNA interferase family)